MILYSCITIPAAIMLFILSISIYKGKTELIHAYHQTNVENKSAYGKGFGRALSIIASGILLSGIVGLFGDDTVIVLFAVVVLFAGIFAGLWRIYKVQKKYNSGVF